MLCRQLVESFQLKIRDFLIHKQSKPCPKKMKHDSSHLLDSIKFDLFTLSKSSIEDARKEDEVQIKLDSGGEIRYRKKTTELLGERGYSKVYKGTLVYKEKEKITVAVKRVQLEDVSDTSKEVVAPLRLREHHNIVTLLELGGDDHFRYGIIWVD